MESSFKDILETGDHLMRIIISLTLLSAMIWAQNPNTAAFPGAVATDSTMLVASNNGISVLTAAMTNSQTSFTITNATNFIAPTAVTIDSEILKCTTLTSATFSVCTRGFQGTTAAAHNQGAVVYENQIAYYPNQSAAEIKAIETALGANLSNIPGSLTLTNDTSTGTVVNELAKISSAGKAILIGTGDTSIPVFLVISGAGTSGAATLATAGLQTCRTDGSGAAIGHFLVASTSTAGRCADAGATAPTTGWVIGQAQTTVSANANVSVLLSQGYNAAAAAAGGTVSVTNDGSSGTTLYQLAKINSSGNAVVTTTSDTGIPIFVVTAGAGTSGSASLAYGGLVACQTDAGGATIGHFLVESTTTAARCSDAGATAPATGWVIGQAQTTATANANTMVLLSQGYNAAAPAQTFSLSNDTSTGTTVNQLAKISSAGKALKTTTSDLGIPVFVVTSGAGTSGSAVLANGGIVACQTDASGATIGDYVGASSATAGRCADLGATPPTSGWVIGQAQTTVGANANVQVALSQGYNAATSGATTFSQLNNGKLVYTSSTVITMDQNCSAAAPCPVNVNGIIRVFSTPATATISAGSPLAYFYVDPTSGARTVAIASGTVTCSGCTTITGSSFPSGAFAYGTWTSSSGTWVTNGLTYLVAPLTAVPVLQAGTCIVPNGWQASLDPTCAELRKVCQIVIGADNGPALVNADLGPQGFQCYVPFAATVLEVMVSANAATPSAVPARNHQGTISDLVSAALATAASGGRACSNIGGTVSLDGVTTCSATLQNTSLSQGDEIDLDAGGVAGGTAARMSVAIVYVAQ